MSKSKEYTTLKDLCDNFRQDIVDGPFGSNLKREDYITEGIPILKIQNIKPFQITLKKMDFVKLNKYDELKRHSYTKGDIIITKLGDPLGAAAIVEDIKDGLIVADLVRIRAQKINTNYLCYHLNSPVTNSFINSLQKGTTRPRIKIEDVRNLPIYCPSLPEQQRIVAILDNAFEAIATAKENAEKNLKNAREIFDGYLQSVFANPRKEWKVKKLGDVCDIIGGGTPSKANQKFYDGNICWATVRDMKNNLITETEFKITDEAVKNSSTNIIPKGNVVIATRVGLGKVCILKNDMAINQDLKGIIPKDSKIISTTYLFHWLKSISDVIKTNGTGATVQGVKLPFVKNIEIPIPTLEEQRRIEDNINALSAETKKLEAIYNKKLADLEELKKSILQKAFNGDL